MARQPSSVPPSDVPVERRCRGREHDAHRFAFSEMIQRKDPFLWWLGLQTSGAAECTATRHCTSSKAGAAICRRPSDSVTIQGLRSMFTTHEPKVPGGGGGGTRPDGTETNQVEAQEVSLAHPKKTCASGTDQVRARHGNFDGTADCEGWLLSCARGTSAGRVHKANDPLDWFNQRRQREAVAWDREDVIGLGDGTSPMPNRAAACVELLNLTFTTTDSSHEAPMSPCSSTPPNLQMARKNDGRKSSGCHTHLQCTQRCTLRQFLPHPCL